jgi:hypothetical protein
MGTQEIHIVVEGFTDQQLCIKLLQTLQLPIGDQTICRGKSNLDKRLSSFNQAKFIPWFILRDLDTDSDCAPTLKNKLLPTESLSMCFRIAVRELEAWILGDAEQIANYLGVSQNKIPMNPESLNDPKNHLINLARKSRRKEIREGMVPRDESGGLEGPEYASMLSQFILDNWRPEIAAQRCDSLRRCIKALQQKFK